MIDSKPFWASTGVIGGLIAFLAAIGPFFGFVIDDNAVFDLNQAIGQIIGGAAALTAVYGRVVATKKIE